MADLLLFVRDRLSGKDFDVEVPDSKRIGELAQALRKELNLPEHDGRGPVSYKFVLQRTGILLDSAQTLRDAGVRNEDTLTFWGEPTAASTDRLRQEYRKVLERFGSHPHVKVEILGSPPEEYRVTYTLKAPVSFNGSTFSFDTTHKLVIRLSKNHPHDKPSVTMQTKACHPNIHFERGMVCIGNNYYTTESIADIIAKVGNYLQYREYNLGNPFSSDVTSYVRGQESAGRRVGPFDSVGFGV